MRVQSFSIEVFKWKPLCTKKAGSTRSCLFLCDADIASFANLLAPADQTRPKPGISIVVRTGLATSGPMRRTRIAQEDHIDLVASLGKGLGAAHDPIVALIEGTGEHEA